MTDPEILEQRAERLLKAPGFLFGAHADNNRREALEADGWNEEQVAFFAAAPQLVRDLLAALSAVRAERDRREAELHGIVADLLAAVDGDDPIFDQLLRRANAVLGAADPDGHCGNPICARLAAAEAALSTLRSEMEKKIKEWRVAADEMTNIRPPEGWPEGWEPPIQSKENKAYCDGKARGLRMVADTLSRLTTQTEHSASE